MPTLFSKCLLTDFPTLKPIKPFFALAALWLLSTAPATPAPVTVGWDASSGSVAGYHIYYGQLSNRYTSTGTVAANATSYTTPDLAAGIYYFAVTAFDSTGDESSYSNEVSTTVAAAAPKPTDGGSPNPGSST
ncbi:MAG: fibronectin type III domain-containing protein, partial [Candidatus Competibacter sp.]